MTREDLVDDPDTFPTPPTAEEHEAELAQAYEDLPEDVGVQVYPIVRATEKRVAKVIIDRIDALVNEARGENDTLAAQLAADNGLRFDPEADLARFYEGDNGQITLRIFSRAGLDDNAPSE